MKTTNERMKLYTAMASLPVAGAAGYTTADIIHYGGPAIQVTYTASTFTSSSDSDGFIYGTIYYGARSNNGADMKTGSWVPTGDTIFGAGMLDATVSSSFSNESGYSYDYISVEKAKLIGFSPAKKGFVEFASNGKGVAKMFASGSMISADAAKTGSPFAALAKDLFASYSSSFSSKSGSGGGSDSTSIIKGNWLPDGDEETRGFAGFFIGDGEGSEGYGWIDIGFDGETLTIYDWAYNTNGSLAAGSTTAVPGGAGLAALAMGAAGLRRRRKRSA